MKKEVIELEKSSKRLVILFIIIVLLFMTFISGLENNTDSGSIRDFILRPFYAASKLSGFVIEDSYTQEEVSEKSNKKFKTSSENIFLFLSPDNLTIDEEEEFEINVSVGSVDDLYGIQLSIDYDPGFLEYVDIQEGDFLKKDSEIFSWGPDTSGHGMIKNYMVTRISSSSGVSGNGTIAKIRFRVINSGTSEVGIFNSRLIDSDIQYLLHLIENSSVTGKIPEKPCRLEKAYWSETKGMEGDTINLTLEGLNCDGRDVSFEIWEDDVLVFDDPVNITPPNATFLNGKAVSSWVAEWQEDFGDPEYYFIASLVSNSSNSINSKDYPNGILVVEEFSECGNGIREAKEICDGDDLDGKTCADFGYDEGESGCCPGCSRFNFSNCRNITKTCVDNDADNLNPYFVSSSVDYNEISCFGSGCKKSGECLESNKTETDTCKGDLIVERICNNDNTIGYREYECEEGCKDGACVISGCMINQLEWSNLLVHNNSKVEMLISGSECDGELMNITIIEKDYFTKDDFVDSISNIRFNNSVEWTAFWTRDERGLPEYYFRVEINDFVYDSSKDIFKMLKVRPSKRHWKEIGIPLKKGKNVFSIPLIAENMSVDYIFRDISQKADKLYTYNSDNKWRIYHFNKSKPSNLLELREGEGYILFMKENTTLYINGSKTNSSFDYPTFNLNQGWNLIGTFSGDTAKSILTVKNILEGVKYDRLFIFNKSSSRYDSLEEKDVLNERYSYWIYVKDKSSFTPITGEAIGG
ncbi:hypothetical protein GF386_00010 [Candidatus Pacearchaeota archaeon]|nr:hypothetical protein [Candidatus Pacearchaeota archaeon]MBD3282663.1 hypothetical protein [Candidatus Pacearchaeota archaeon]